MAGRKEVRAVGPSAQMPDRKLGAQRTVNMYPQEGEDGWVLRSCPSIRAASSADQPNRALAADDRYAFFVANNKLYRLTSTVASTEVGTLNTNSGDCRICLGRDQAVVVDGGSGYVYTFATGVFSQISDPDWRGSYDVETLDGYFVFVPIGSSDQFYISAIDDASTLNALDFSSSDVLPDNLVTIRAHKRELFLFGRQSVEVWVNSGGSDFPFVRFGSVPIEIGIVGRRAVTRAADTLFFVGQTTRGRGIVYMIDGHQPKPISTLAVETALQATGVDLEQCVMCAYQIPGAEFVHVEAPGMKTSWVYDARSGQWHEQARWSDEYAPMGFFDAAVIPASLTPEAFAPASVVLAIASDVIFKIDHQDGAKYHNFGGSFLDPMVRERTWPHLMSPSFEEVNYRSLELRCKTGDLTDDNGGTYEPREAIVTLEVSNDGGYNFHAPLHKSLGVTGRYAERIRWNFLGSARDRVFRIKCSDFVDFTIHAAHVDA